MSLNLALCSNDNKFKGTIKRSLEFLHGSSVGEFKEEEALIKRNTVILLLCEESELKAVIYEKIRSRYLNPIVVIGYKEKALFEREHPLFCDHPYNHAYIESPFAIGALFTLLTNMKPISSQAIRKAICGSDGGFNGYLWKCLDHDLLKDKGQCIRILRSADEFFNDKSVTNKIAKSIKGISKKDGEWSLIARDIAEELKGLLRKEKQ